MTGLDVAEPQPLWLSLQHTLPSLEISETPAHVAAGAAHVAAGSAHALVVIADSDAVLAELADSAGLQLHRFPSQFPLVKKFSIYLHSHRWLLHQRILYM